MKSLQSNADFVSLCTRELLERTREERPRLQAKNRELRQLAQEMQHGGSKNLLPDALGSSNYNDLGRTVAEPKRVFRTVQQQLLACEAELLRMKQVAQDEGARRAEAEVAAFQAAHHASVAERRCDELEVTAAGPLAA